jgi:uncharacterized protein (TIGR02466 family)
MDIHSLFPIPVGITDVSNVLNDEHIRYAHECSKFYTINHGNTTSVNSYVLDSPNMYDLKQALLQSVNDYISKVIHPLRDGSIDCYITQSWFNYTNTGQFHHSHSHPNSFVSGVLYLNADMEKDTITFRNQIQSNFCLQIDGHPNDFNSKEVFFKNKVGNVIIFPSSLQHSVNHTTSEQTRISLAFNTFLRGYIGDDRTLTGLCL